MLPAKPEDTQVSGPRPPKSTLDYLSTYGGIPIDGNARVDSLGSVRPEAKKKRKRTGKGKRLKYRKRNRDVYELLFEGDPVGSIIRNHNRPREYRWEIKVFPPHYLSRCAIPSLPSMVKIKAWLVKQW